MAQILYSDGSTFKHFLKFVPKNCGFWSWMGQFFFKISTCMGGTSKFSAAYHYPDQSLVRFFFFFFENSFNSPQQQKFYLWR